MAQAETVAQLLLQLQDEELFLLGEMHPEYLIQYKHPRKATVGEVQLCRMVVVTTPADFAFHLDPDRRVADQISRELKTIYDAEPDQQDPINKKIDYTVEDHFLYPGVPVAARCMDDTEPRWYRAIIESIDDTLGKKNPVKVRFVDYLDCQDYEVGQLKMLPVHMGDTPPLAIRACLQSLDAKEETTAEADTHFWTWTQSLTNNMCSVDFCEYNAVENVFIVRLFNARDGTEYIFPMDMRKPKSTPSGAIAFDLVNLGEGASGSSAQQSTTGSESAMAEGTPPHDRDDPYTDPRFQQLTIEDPSLTEYMRRKM